MKDNIDSKNIENRKIIIELRFDPCALISDKKGTVIEKIKKLNIFNPCQWEFDFANAYVFDSSKRENSTNLIIIEVNRICFISNKINSIDSYFNNFSTIYKCILEEIGLLNIHRIGCRIQGTYNSKSKDFESILEGFKKGFPEKFYFDSYPATDLMFQLIYKNGRYCVGPVNEGKDEFVDNNFTECIRKKHNGFGIDTDNYIMIDTIATNALSQIKDIFILSLAVEKQLFENLKDL